MDHLEEQRNEIEALDSIYFGEMEVISKEPYYSFNIPIKSEDYEKGVCGILCLLRFEYTPKYPDECPIIEVEDGNLNETELRNLQDYLLEQAKENLGMVMIFTLVSAAQEWLNLKSDELRVQALKDEEEKKKRVEEEEMKKFEGTRVTVETFLAWKQAFDEEMKHLRKKDEKNSKLTGRELFMQDKSLNESDLKFLEDGDLVKVDESLFQDMDDLEIDDAELLSAEED